MKLEHLPIGAILDAYDFTDQGSVQSGAQSEISQGIMEGSLQATIMENVLCFCGLLTARIAKMRQIDFLFLPYAQGSINYCEPQGKDVLSAYFSGCIMARYKRNGSWRVCHVSTGEPNDCKDKWDRIKNEPEVSDVSEFKPHERVDASKILGLITNTGNRYAIGCKSIQNPKGGKMLLEVIKVVLVQT